jgi:ketosteroid isomerase-like protein
MAYNVPRSVVETFCAVYAARDVEKIAEFLHDDVVWTISGPVDVLSYCGTHCGKAVVKDLIARKVLSMFRVISFVQESMLADGDRVAMLNRRTAQRIADGRLISYRVANFLRFQDGKVIENLSLLDSFDAAEQMLGRSLAVNSAPAPADGNIIAL